MKVRLIAFALSTMLFAPGLAHANWYGGKIKILGFDYSGLQAVFQLEGITLPCSCPTYWANYACLLPSRQTYEQEYALLLSAQARDVTVRAFINPTSCAVGALYEEKP